MSATSSRESLGRIGAWSFALESLTAAEERDAVAEIESFGCRAIWFPESVESREVFAHAGWILAGTERGLAVSGIANIWASDLSCPISSHRCPPMRELRCRVRHGLRVRQ